MIGFLIGTACLLGLVKVLRHGRGCGYGRGCGGYGGGCGGGGCGCGGHGGGCGGGRWGHEGGHGRFGGDAQRWVLRGLFQRLDTTPGQEKVIVAAVEGLRAQTREAREVLQDTKTHAARAFRGEHFDEAAMAEAFTRQDAALESTQKALFEALAKVHEALDERQRRELADLMERFPGAWGAHMGSRWGGGQGGPYRA